MDLISNEITTLIGSGRLGGGYLEQVQAQSLQWGRLWNLPTGRCVDLRSQVPIGV